MYVCNATVHVCMMLRTCMDVHADVMLRTYVYVFQDSLHSLVTTLGQANPYFVRCLKPNNIKQADNFMPQTVMNQLKYSGMCIYVVTSWVRDSHEPTQYSSMYVHT